MSQHEKDTHRPSPGTNKPPPPLSPTHPKEGIASSGKAGRGGVVGGQGLGAGGQGLGPEGGLPLTRLNFDDSDDEGQGPGGKAASKGRPPANPSLALAPPSAGMTLSARGNNPHPAGGQGLGPGPGPGATTAETKKKMVPIKTFSVDF